MSRAPTSASRKPRSREEGAVLLVVLMILMIVTATAVYSVHAASSDLSGAGASRTAFQTDSAAASLVEGTIDMIDRSKPRMLYSRLDANLVNGIPLDLTNAEPVPMDPTRMGIRLDVNDLNTMDSGAHGLEAVGASSLNNGVPQVLDGVVDVYDVVKFNGDIAGARSDGYGNFAYVQWTITGRATTHLDLGASASDDLVRRHSTTSTARAVITSGPMPNY